VLGTAYDDYYDPDKECSSKLAQNIQAAISCYTKIHKERKWKAMQLTLEFFLKKGNLTTV